MSAYLNDQHLLRHKCIKQTETKAYGAWWFA